MSKTYTQHYNLTKDGKEEFYDVAVANGNMDLVDTALHESKTKITTLETEMTAARGGEVNLNARLEKIDRQQGDVLVPPIPLGFGMTTIEKKGPYPSMLDVDFVTTDYVNLLGKMGSCESLTGWTAFSGTVALDSINKVSGSSCLKTSGYTANGYGQTSSTITGLYDKTKDYILVASASKGTATQNRVRIFDGIAEKSFYGGVNMTRCVVRIPANFFTGTAFHVEVITIGDSSVYAYTDDIAVIQVPAADLALSDAELIAKYPYGESHVMTINPCIANTKDNLVSNGNCEEGTAYWETSGPGVAVSVENDRFKVINVLGNWVKQRIKVPKNTVMYYGHNVIGVGGEIKTLASTTLRYGAGIFNTGNNEEIDVFYYGSSTGTYYFDSVIVNAYTEKVPTYKPQSKDQCYAEGFFTKHDKVSIINGRLVGYKGSKTTELDGSRNYTLNANYPNYKWVYADAVTDTIPVYPNTVMTAIKYDGKPLVYGVTTDGPDRCNFGSMKNINITISNADSGWTEAISPNGDEIKAERMGWKALASDGARYVAFVSKIDGSTPSGARQTTIPAGGSGTSITVLDASKFTSGRWFVILTPSGTLRGFASAAIVGNVMTFSVSHSWSTGDIVMQCDYNATDAPNINYCKANRAPNYTPDKITYVLSKPLPINKESEGYTVRIKGKPLTLEQGFNYVKRENGVVLGETVKPVYDGFNWLINNNDTEANRKSLLSNKLESFNRILQNGAVDTNWIYWSLGGYGRYQAYQDGSLKLFNPSAAYGVDYRIIATDAPNIGTTTFRYTDSLPDALEGIADMAASRQAHSSVLDSISEHGKYQIIRDIVISGRPYMLGYASGIYPSLYQTFLLTPRMMSPTGVASLKFGNVYDASGGVTTVPISDLIIGINTTFTDKVRVVVGYRGTNATLKANAMDYGLVVSFDLALACSI